MKKIILIIMTGVIVAGGIGTYFVFKKPESNVYQCPLYNPPAPSFYENCQKQGGSVEVGEKNDKGCQMPPQCVLSGTSDEKDNGTSRKNSPFGFSNPFTLPKIDLLKFNESLSAFNFSSENQFHDYILDNLNFLLKVKFIRGDVFYNLDNKWIEGEVPTLTKFKDKNWSILITLNTWPEGLPADTGSFKKAVRDLVQKYPWVKYWQIGNEVDMGEGWKKNYR